MDSQSPIGLQDVDKSLSILPEYQPARRPEVNSGARDSGRIPCGQEDARNWLEEWKQRIFDLGGKAQLDFVTLAGSRHQPGASVIADEAIDSSDLDLVCRFRGRLVESRYRDLVAATRATGFRGEAPRVDTVHCLLPSRRTSGLRVHLVVHDAASWQDLSPVVRLYMALGEPLLGEDEPEAAAQPAPARTAWPRDRRRIERMVTRGQAPLARWALGPEPYLRRGWRAARTEAEREKVAKHAEALVRGWAFLFLAAAEGRAAESAVLAAEALHRRDPAKALAHLGSADA